MAGTCEWTPGVGEDAGLNLFQRSVHAVLSVDVVIDGLLALNVYDNLSPLEDLEIKNKKAINNLFMRK